ncbi:hypothetical protein D3C76_953730 [compost metagenome]
MNPGLGVDSAGGGAVLAGVVVAVGAHALYDGVDVGVVADDHRRLAAEFQMGALEGAGGGLEDLLAGDDIAGERHHAHARVADQRAADALAATADEVQHARRKDLGECRRQRQHRQRRVLGRLEHHGIAGGQRRGDLPRGHHQRVVPWRDGSDHAERVAAHHAGVAGHVFAGELALLAAHGAGEEAEHIGDGGNVVLPRQMQRLAAVQCFQAGEGIGALVDGVGDGEEGGGALCRGGARPAGEGALGGFDGLGDLFDGGFGDGHQGFAGGRIEDRLDQALADHQLTVDQQFGMQGGDAGGAGHLGSSFLLGLVFGGHVRAPECVVPGTGPFVCSERLDSGREVDKF